MTGYERLLKRVKQQTLRMKKAQVEHTSLLAQTFYLGTLGLLLVLPPVAGAYLGSWLDSLSGGYSMHWTLSLIFLGVVIGAFNVYRFIKD
ncbi:AtpZ/AtpI family protein [Acidithiobacillus sp.]|uniref:AtpZ/AtpI family protein n=1 Tax=Acidithiobacillus sp. TaxID=1872118 RepID=UPI003CFD3562